MIVVQTTLEVRPSTAGSSHFDAVDQTAADLLQLSATSRRPERRTNLAGRCAAQGRVIPCVDDILLARAF